MSNDTNLPTKHNSHTAKTFSKELLRNGDMSLLLGAGVFILLCNVFFRVKPNALLCYLDIRYLPIYAPASIILWVSAIWLASETTDSFEDYIPLIRISLVTLILLTIIFALRSFYGITSPSSKEYPLWFDTTIVVAVFCAVRSLFLLYDYRYRGAEAIDLDEAKWFWGLSGFIFAIVVAFVIMYFTPVRTQTHAGMNKFVTESLLVNCIHGLRGLIWTWQGTLALRAFGILIVIVSTAFFYVAGKWGLAYWSKIWDE